MFFWPQKPNYPERSLSNLGQRRFSPLYPPDPLLFNVSHPTIKNSLSEHCDCEKRKSFVVYLTENQLFLPFPSPAPSPPLLCPVSLLFRAKSVLPPLPLPLFHALFISAELAKDKVKGYPPFTHPNRSEDFCPLTLTLSYLQTFTFLGTCCRRILRKLFQTAQLDGKTKSVRVKKKTFYATDLGFIILRNCVPVKTQWIDNDICFDN